MKVPRIWRKKRGKKEYGACLATIAGEDVNLGTKSYELARQRLVEALRGKRNFPSDVELAAQALEADLGGAAAAEPPAPDAGVPGTSPRVAATPPAPAPIVPDVIEPPRALPPLPEADARAEAEATNAAAAETGGAAGGDQAEPGPFSADALEGMLETAAQMVVEGQLWAQAWLIERKTGLRPEPLPEPADPRMSIRRNASKAWVEQFKRWFPDMSDTPPWLMAVALPLFALPHQAMSAKPVEKEADPPAAQAAA